MSTAYREAYPMGALSKRLKRRSIWNVTGGYCYYCGADLKEGGMTVDHVVPRALGGSSSPENLVPACRPCNEAKGCLPLDEYRALQDRKTFYGEGRRGRRMRGSAGTARA